MYPFLNSCSDRVEDVESERLWYGCRRGDGHFSENASDSSGEREKKKETVLVRWVQVRCWTLFLETQAVCLKKIKGLVLWDIKNYKWSDRHLYGHTVSSSRNRATMFVTGTSKAIDVFLKMFEANLWHRFRSTIAVFQPVSNLTDQRINDRFKSTKAVFQPISNLTDQRINWSNQPVNKLIQNKKHSTNQQ